MSRRILSFFVAVLVVCAAVVKSEAQIPKILSLSPGSGVIGSVVRITGENFSPAASQNIVRFGAVRGEVMSASSTELTVGVPPSATCGAVTVTVGGLIATSATPFVVTFPSNRVIDLESFGPEAQYSWLQYSGGQLSFKAVDFDDVVVKTSSDVFDLGGCDNVSRVLIVEHLVLCHIQ